jgi:predicted DNA-binding transcriptional regulator AlpA
MAEDELLRERELAALLKLSLSQVKKMRAEGTGPPFIRLSERAIRYRRSAVEEWLRRRAE